MLEYIIHIYPQTWIYYQIFTMLFCTFFIHSSFFVFVSRLVIPSSPGSCVSRRRQRHQREVRITSEGGSFRWRWWQNGVFDLSKWIFDLTVLRHWHHAYGQSSQNGRKIPVKYDNLPRFFMGISWASCDFSWWFVASGLNESGEFTHSREWCFW